MSKITDVKKLKKGVRYLVVYLHQRKPRELVGVFLGKQEQLVQRELVFSLRPASGTSEIPAQWFISAEVTTAEPMNPRRHHGLIEIEKGRWVTRVPAGHPLPVVKAAPKESKAEQISRVGVGHEIIARMAEKAGREGNERFFAKLGISLRTHGGGQMKQNLIYTAGGRLLVRTVLPDPWFFQAHIGRQDVLLFSMEDYSITVFLGGTQSGRSQALLVFQETDAPIETHNFSTGESYGKFLRMLSDKLISKMTNWKAPL